ncbi:MAG: ATP-binding protein [Elainellaceae cyanobacterium]
MWMTLKDIFSPSRYMPHGQCYLWQTELVWLHGISDVLIALAYYSIPIFLIYVSYQRPDIPFRGFFGLFGVFILACGTTHLLEVWTLWHPAYWLSGIVKAATALISLYTAMELIPLTPKVLQWPSPSQLQKVNQQLEEMNCELETRVEQRTTELSNAIYQLRQEVEQRQQAEVTLKQSNEELKQFVYVASHDLQEPLRVINSYAELLAAKYENLLDEKAEKYLSRIVSGAIRMKALIEDLLSYSKVSNFITKFSTTDCNKIVEESIGLLGVSIEKEQATVTYDTLPTVKANSEQLVRLFQNLIGNAIKYRRECAPRIHITSTQEDGYWLFSVEDNGIGIESQYTERIFIIFQRLHSRRHYDGTGLGLAISKKIIEQHDGKIWVESVPGEGSNFWFTLPIDQEV